MTRKKRSLSKRRRTNKALSSSPVAGAAQTHDLPELQRARRFWQEKQYDRALSLFDQTVRKNPRNLAALTDAARAFGERFELARAESLLDRMIELAPDQSEVLFLAGQSYRMIHRPGKALECLRRVARRGDALPDAYLELAMLCERRNDLDEAVDAIDTLLRREPNYAEAKIVKAVLHIRHDEYKEADTLLADVVRNTDVHWLSRARAWSERARLLDKQQQYDDAMASVLEAKRILSNHNEQLIKFAEDEIRHHQNLLDLMTSDYLEKWASKSASFEHQDVALLTGSPRSGTTLLEKVLDSHPGVVSSDERQALPRFVQRALFEDSDRTGDTLSPQWLDAITPDRLLANRRRYLTFIESALGEPIGGRLHVDKNPSLTPVLPTMLRLFPECRVIVALRDPRDVILSCFMTHLPVNPATASYFTIEGAAKRYAYEMDAWMKMRGIMKSTWVESRYEDMVSDRAAESRRVVDALGLPWNEAVLSYRDHLKTRQTDSPTYSDVNKPVYSSSIGRWKNYENYLEPAMPALEPFIEAFGYQ